MAKFKYTAIKSGKTVGGQIESVTKEAALASLDRQKIRVIVIKQQSAGINLFSQKAIKVKSKDLVVFTRQLSTMVSAGVPLVRSLNTLQQQAENKNFKKVVGSVAKDIEGGKSLADSMNKFPGVFNEIYISMVRAGEAGGILDEILKRLAAQVEKDASIRKKLKSASAYPLAITVITVAAFFAITTVVMPKLGSILKDLGGENLDLPIYTQIMLGFSDFIRANLLLIIAASIISLFLLRKYIKTPSGKYKFHALLLKIPVIKTVVTKIAIARFSRTFASLMSAGVTVLDALEVTGGAIGNKVIEADLKEAAKQVRNGKQLSEPISQSKHFPPIVAQMLAVGEETGETDTVLIKVADFYEEEVDALIDGLSSLIEPVMIILLGGMVGLIAASVMGPIASLSQNIGSGD